MFIRFSVVAGPTIKMFEKEALEMLRAMGQSGTVPSAMASEDVLAAVTSLQSALNKRVESEQPVKDGYGDDVVDIKTRAFPLIELLNTAVKESKSVMWEMV